MTAAQLYVMEETAFITESMQMLHCDIKTVDQ